jgi:amino acid transporter
VDEDRRIRFLVPPVLFAASLLLGASSDETTRSLIRSALANADLSKWIGVLVGLIAGAGILVFAVGYVIGTCTLLRLFFRYILKIQFHEAPLSDHALPLVWKTLHATGSPSRKQKLSATVAFDFDVLREKHERVHHWLIRRWNAFSIASTSLFGLILSFLCGYGIGMALTATWIIPVVIFMIILVFVMTWAWRDNMSMLDFMALLPEKEK